MRVFVNDKAVDVPRGARVRDAVAQADDGLARLLDGAAYVTDAAGRPIDAGDAVREAGAVYRVVVSARRAGKPRLTKDALRRWPKAELHVHLDGALRPATHCSNASCNTEPLTVSRSSRFWNGCTW